MDGAALHISRADCWLYSARSGAGCSSSAIRLRHHLRNEQRVRLRLLARQRYGHHTRTAGPARLSLRDCRRSRLDLDRRSADAAHHQRPGHDLDPSVRQMETADRATSAQTDNVMNRVASEAAEKFEQSDVETAGRV